MTTVTTERKIEIQSLSSRIDADERNLDYATSAWSIHHCTFSIDALAHLTAQCARRYLAAQVMDDAALTQRAHRNLVRSVAAYAMRRP